MMKSARKIQGFTLIELLVVLAVLAIIAGAVVVAINPLQQIRRANDGKVKSDIGQIATAAQSYFVVYQSYPEDIAGLVTSGDLTKAPTAPTGYTYTSVTIPGVCTGNVSGTACTKFYVYSTLLAPKESTKPMWCWNSSGNVAQEVADVTACANL